MFNGVCSCGGEAGNPSMRRERPVLQFHSCWKDVGFDGFVIRIISLARLMFCMCYGLNYCVPSKFIC